MTKSEMKRDLRDHHCVLSESWWEHDGRGIPLCRVCNLCKKVKLSVYRPEILRYYTEADVDETIEAEPGVELFGFDEDW